MSTISKCHRSECTCAVNTQEWGLVAKTKVSLHCACLGRGSGAEGFSDVRAESYSLSERSLRPSEGFLPPSNLLTLNICHAAPLPHLGRSPAKHPVSIQQAALPYHFRELKRKRKDNKTIQDSSCYSTPMMRTTSQLHSPLQVKSSICKPRTNKASKSVHKNRFWLSRIICKGAI